MKCVKCLIKTMGVAALVAAFFTFPLVLHFLSPSVGDPCADWHASTAGSKGQTLVCTHLPDSGHLMYWETQVMDR